MAKDRIIQCKNYTYEGGPCDKRGINCFFWGDMQKCKCYEKKPGGNPARHDLRRKKNADFEKKLIKEF